MISASTLSITQADMQIAIAYWLNATAFKEPVRVTKVEVESKNYGTEHFKVTCERATPDDTGHAPHGSEGG